MAKVCWSKLRNTPKHTNVVDGGEDLSESTHMLFDLPSRRVPPIVLCVAVNGQEVSMELDTGASVSLITDRVWKEMVAPHPVLRPSVIKLRTYTGETIDCLGEISVSVGYNQQQHNCRMAVVKGEGPCLLGRDCLQHFQVPWRDVLHTMAHNPSKASLNLEEVVGKYPSLFHDELGKASQHEAQLNVPADTKPS